MASVEFHIDSDKYSRQLSVSVMSKRLNGMPERTLRDWAIKGKLPAYKIDGKSWAVDERDFERFCRGLGHKIRLEGEGNE